MRSQIRREALRRIKSTRRSAAPLRNSVGILTICQNLSYFCSTEFQKFRSVYAFVRALLANGASTLYAVFSEFCLSFYRLSHLPFPDRCRYLHKDLGVEFFANVSVLNVLSVVGRASIVVGLTAYPVYMICILQHHMPHAKSHRKSNSYTHTHALKCAATERCDSFE